MKRSCKVLLGLLLLARGLCAAQYHVSPEGSATNSGAMEKPFGTIQQAADAARAGDRVLIHAGVYRESVRLTHSGAAGKPITFSAVRGEKVVLSGADLFASDWSPCAGNVYKTHAPRAHPPAACRRSIDDRSTLAQHVAGSPLGSWPLVRCRPGQPVRQDG